MRQRCRLRTFPLFVPDLSSPVHHRPRNWLKTPSLPFLRSVKSKRNQVRSEALHWQLSEPELHTENRTVTERRSEANLYAIHSFHRRAIENLGNAPNFIRVIHGVKHHTLLAGAHDHDVLTVVHRDFGDSVV